MSTFTRSSVMVLCAGLLASAAWAQPANRPAAFQSAIAAALAQAPGWFLYETALENDDGQWVFEVDVVSANGLAMLEYEVDASSFAVRRSRNQSLSAGKVAQIQAVLAGLPATTITHQQAFGVVVPRTPDGTQMQQVELGVESAHVVYKFDFAGVSGVQRVVVDAVTGLPAGVPSTGSGPAPGGVTLDQAIQVALGLYPGARVLESEFEAGDNRWEIKLISAQGEVRKVRVAAAGGGVLSDDQHRRGREDTADDRLRLLAMQNAAITLAQAKQIAEATAAGATAVKAEWEFEHGRLVAKVVLQDAAGLRTVFLDAASGNAVTPTPDAPASPPPAPVLDAAAAVTAAINATSGTAAIEVEMEPKGGRQFYKVKTLSLASPLRLREVVVDGKTGVIWSSTLMPMATSYLSTAQRLNTLRSTATRSFRDAQVAALAALGDGQVQSIELEAEQNAFLVYDVKVLVGAKLFELVVDGRTGTVSPK